MITLFGFQVELDESVPLDTIRLRNTTRMRIEAHAASVSEVNWPTTTRTIGEYSSIYGVSLEQHPDGYREESEAIAIERLYLRAACEVLTVEQINALTFKVLQLRSRG